MHMSVIELMFACAYVDVVGSIIEGNQRSQHDRDQGCLRWVDCFCRAACVLLMPFMEQPVYNDKMRT